MSKVIIMGMIFDENDVPDFGSIYRVCERQNNVHDYGLNSADVSKLDLITNAAPGSTALCDDTADIYRLTKSGWVKFGESTETETEPLTSLNLLNLSPNLTSLTPNTDRVDLSDHLDEIGKESDVEARDEDVK